MPNPNCHPKVAKWVKRKMRCSSVNPHGVMPKAGTTSSMRVQAVGKCINHFLTNAHPKRTEQALCAVAKDVKIAGYEHIATCEEKSVPFDACEKGIVYGACPNLKQIDSACFAHNGCIHCIPEEHLDMIGIDALSSALVPRECTLQHVNAANTKKVCSALNAAQGLENFCVRSKKKTGSSDTSVKCTIIGNKVARGHHGFSRDKLIEVSPESQATLERMARRVEDCGLQVISSGHLRGLSHVANNGLIETLGGTRMVAGLASSVDYSAPSHTDIDSSLSFHQINVEGWDPKLEDPIVQYFCFPWYGYCVGLRPGDVLVFNPKVHHCLSSKTEDYSNERVHVSAFHLKQGHVGLNNNALPLQDEYLMCMDSELFTRLR